MGGVGGIAEKVSMAFLRLLIGGAFMYAGGLKALDPAQFAADVDNFRLLPYPLACVVGVYLPWVEILGGAALALGIYRAGATLLLGGLLVIFLTALVSAWARGLDIACGCFGNASPKSELWQSISMDLAMLAILCVVSIRTRVFSEPYRDAPPSTAR
jgi:uncharacterized membrane protein YphA (DoxX/SURF4 family)